MALTFGGEKSCWILQSKREEKVLVCVSPHISAFKVFPLETFFTSEYANEEWFETDSY